MRRLAVLGTLGVLAFSSSSCNRINSFARDKDAMAEPGASAFKPKSEEATKPKTTVLEGVKIIPVGKEESFSPEIAAKLGFKKTPFFTGRYADSALWRDGKGNAVVTNEDGKRVKERGKLISLSKNSFTIELDDGEQLKYYPNGLFSSFKLDVEGPRRTR